MDKVLAKLKKAVGVYEWTGKADVDLQWHSVLGAKAGAEILYV